MSTTKVAFETTIPYVKSVILNQIIKNESFRNYIFKKLRFENIEN
jgi:hypothetical protein